LKAQVYKRSSKIDIARVSIDRLSDFSQQFRIIDRFNVKESCRIRIRNAAGFISRVIDSVVEESDAEDSEILTAIATANHPVGWIQVKYSNFQG
jgi:hypothetical protein